MTRSQTTNIIQANLPQLKKELLSDYLLSNNMAVRFSDDEKNTLYLQQPEKQSAHFAEAIVTLMESINFIVILDGRADQLEGCVYSPSEGLYAGLPPIHFISSSKIEEKVSDD